MIHRRENKIRGLFLGIGEIDVDEVETLVLGRSD